MSEYRVAVVGATGAVGTVMRQKLRERSFPAREIVPFASERSAGKELEGVGTIQPLTDETIQGFDLAIFSAGAHSPEVVAPAENRAMSKPWIVSSVSGWTIAPSSSRPAERAEANGTISRAGNPRSRNFARMTVPTAPVAPTTATR